MARVLFITGFNRSGTTLVTTAVTEAARATTLTVGHLARHMPSIDEFLTTSQKEGTAPDRGVDRLPVNESTPEEYGWLLNAKTGEMEFGAKAAESGVLRDLVDELADDSEAPTVVLKNPWDTGHEQLLLDHFPDSRVLLVRRQISAIEDSLERAWSRMATSNNYIRALIGVPETADVVIGIVLDPTAREKTVDRAKQRTRRAALRLARGASKLPLDRVAFLSYDELRNDPRAGAAWAAHIVDPEALAKAVSAHTFPEYNRVRPSSLAVSAIDRYWALAWRWARAKQVRAGILPKPKSR
ncbi:MAG: hypothetical protein AUI14_25705 [Actinobacteria bacterium 13_2_20CM_2_71_6]|nr:MAG: hypothetical protein AUI14_25705 [Actinobacteria bacterium 13_2_20CM_2_71_6]